MAELPIMQRRKEMWYALNDGRPGARPPVIVETWTFDRDFLPQSLFRCKSQAGRAIERQLLVNLRNHELIDDDKVMPADFTLGWVLDIDEFGVNIPVHTLPDSQGVETGYRYEHPIKNLREDFHILRPLRVQVDRDETFRRKAHLEEIFDGRLPVRLTSHVFSYCMLTNRLIELMGMEAFFMAMYDCPDELHALMAHLRDNALTIQRYAEKEQLLRVNNGNDTSFGSSFNFTTLLPAGGYSGPPARLCDMWGCANSQETVGVSPAMFHEFCFPYYRDAVAALGLLYYGCCEPAHPFWDDIRQLPHLKKVSISRWCDQAFMADALRGGQIVFSRKPDPRFLGVDVKLDEPGWTAHIRETLDLTRDVFTEFIVRDVYTVHGDLGKPRRAVELARAEIDKFFPKL